MRRVILFLVVTVLITVPIFSQQRVTALKPELVIPIGHNEDITYLSVSRDGKFCISDSQDGIVKLWDIESGREIRTFIGSSYLQSVGFTGIGDEILTADGDGLRKWNILNGEETKIFNITTSEYKVIPSDPLNNISFSSDMELVFIEGVLYKTESSENKKLVPIFEKVRKTAKEKHLIKKLTSYEEYASACFSPDNNFLLTGGYDSILYLLDIQKDSIVHKFVGHSGSIDFFCFSPDGKYSISASFNDSTIILWDNSNGSRVGNFTENKQGLSAICFSPDGTSILSGTIYGTVNIWDIASGAVIESFKGISGPVKALCFANNGKEILIASGQIINQWSYLTKEKIKTFGSKTNTMTNPIILPDGKGFIFTTAGPYFGTRNEVYTEYYEPSGIENTAKIWDFSLGMSMRNTKSSKPGFFYLLAVSPNNKYCLSKLYGDNYIRRYNLMLSEISTGNEILLKESQFELPDHPSWEYFSPDGTHIILPGEENNFELWNIPDLKKICDLKSHKRSLTCASFSNDNNYLLTGSYDKTIKLWEIKSGKCIKTFKGHTSAIYFVCFSDDGKFIASASADNSMKIWDIKKGKEIRTFNYRDHMEDFLEANPNFFRKACFSPDGKSIASVDDSDFHIWDIKTGEKKHSIPYILCRNILHFSIDGKEIKIPDANWKEIFNIYPGKNIFDYPNAKDCPNWWINRNPAMLSFSNDLKYALAKNDGKTITLWNADTAIIRGIDDKKYGLADLISINDQDWAVVSPSGLFDASEGAMKELYFVSGLETIDLEKLKDRYYEPGLLLKLLGINKEPLRQVDSLQTLELYPAINLSPVEQGILYVDLIDRGGGIGRVVVTINRKEIDLAPENEVKKDDGKTVQRSYNIKNHPYLVAGAENEIEVKAYNAENWLVSRGVKEVYVPPAPKVISPPNLYAIVAGASNYRGDLLDLSFASKDAADFARVLGYSSGRLFGTGNANIKLLNTDGDAGSYPTKNNLKQAFTDVASKAKSGDIFILYLAGHGTSWGGQDGDFYYLTPEAADGNLTDPAIRQSVAVSGSEITQWFKEVAALKQVLIMDVCHAGKLADDLMASRSDMSSSVIRSYERMKDRTGMYILAGSAADAVSYETSLYGQGLLTYSLIFGMKGAALRDGEFVDVMKLFQHSADQVPQLAQGIGGIQRPQVRTPYGGQSFDIGRVTAEEQTKITLKAPKPMFLRSSFQDEAQMDDVLGINDALDAQLRDLSSKGGEANIVFIDASRFSEAYKVTGRYTSAGGKITANIVLRKGDAQITKLTIEAVNKEVLVKKIVEEVMKTTNHSIPKNIGS